MLQSSDTSGYDEYVEGVEPDETASLETHIAEVGGAFTLKPHPLRIALALAVTFACQASVPYIPEIGHMMPPTLATCTGVGGILYEICPPLSKLITMSLCMTVGQCFSLNPCSPRYHLAWAPQLTRSLCVCVCVCVLGRRSPSLPPSSLLPPCSLEQRWLPAGPEDGLEERGWTGQERTR